MTLKSIKGLNVRPETTKLPEENIGTGSDGREWINLKNMSETVMKK